MTSDHSKAWTADAVESENDGNSRVTPIWRNNMSSTGSWLLVEVAGKQSDVFEPSIPNPNRYAVIYLHGVHLNRLIDKPAFTAEFERHGLRVIAPMTGRSWWTDRVCPEFDQRLTAERHLLDNILPWMQQQWDVA